MPTLLRRALVVIATLVGMALLPSASLANNGDTNGHYGSPGR